MDTNTKDRCQIRDEAEQAFTQKQAQNLCSLLSLWASCYPVICAYRAAQVAVMVTNVLPDLPLPASLLVGKQLLFIQSVEALAAGRVLPYTDFLRAGERWDAIARGGEDGHPEPDDELGIVLASIRADLAEYPLFASLRDLWSRRLYALLLALAQEYLDGLNSKIRGEEALPRMDEYLLGGLHTSGFPLWATTALIVLDAPGVLRQLPAVNEAILHAGASIRMYSDARAYEMGAGEDSINAILIMQRELMKSSLNRSKEERALHAKEIILHLADQYADKCCGLVEPPLTLDGRFEQMIQKSLAYHSNVFRTSRFYRESRSIPAASTYSAIHSR